MTDYETSQQEISESPDRHFGTKDIAITDTDAGFLVFECEYHQQTKKEPARTYHLIGFANVTDQDIVMDAARRQGYNDVLSFPEFEIDKKVLQGFQTVNKISQEEKDRNE